MKTHLSPDELVTALDDALAPARAEHVRLCDACAANVDQLRTTLGTVRDDVPEPSPLFWDHLSERIRVATATETLPRRAPWWASGWGRATGIGALAAAAAIVVALRFAPAPVDSARPSPVVTDTVSAASSGTDDDSWSEMEQIAAHLSADDVHAVVAAAPELAPTVGELSAREREAFVRLLGSELSGDLQ